MHPNHKTIENFYTAFAFLDAPSMAACYAPEVEFQDEVFRLHGRQETAAMWRMLCEGVRAKGRMDWKLEFRDVRADDTSGQAHWDANYRFTATGNMVLNRIEARFRFNQAGLIVEHRDSFDFWRWARQALGAPGLFLGWTPLLRNKVRAQADANLRRFMAQSGPAGANT